MARVAAKPYLQPLHALAGVVRELELVAGHSLQEYRDGVYVHRAAERLVQLAVDLACGLGLRAMGEAGDRMPSGYEETFQDLASAGLLPAPLAEKMEGAASLRRRITYGWPVQPGEDAEALPDSDEELHRRLPFLAVLFREYGRHMETVLRTSRT